MKRGSAVECDRVGALTFCKTFERSATRHREEALAERLDRDGKIFCSFKKCLGDHTVQGHSDRRIAAAAKSRAANGGDGREKTSKGLSFDSRVEGRPQRGYDLFVQANFHSGLDGNTTFQKRKTLDAKWHALGKDGQAPYRASARVAKEKYAEHENENDVQFLHRCGELARSRLSHRKTRYASERMKAIQTTIEEIIEHDVFSAGSAVHDFDKGIKPVFIKNQTMAEVKTEFAETFRYDYKAVPNPSGMGFFQACPQLHGGFCPKEIL